MSVHTHLAALAPKRVLLWHRHPKSGGSHKMDMDAAHPVGDPRREMLRTWDGRILASPKAET